jgi:protein-tyrosine phosphatase
MIDLHNHILPGLDDGADTWQKSIAMARVASADGITDIVCTPHWISGKYENKKADILSRVDEFRRLIAKQEIALNIYPGAELHFDLTLPERIKAGEVMTINDTGSYALIELPEESIPDNLEDFLWRLELKDIQPIISHVERHPLLYKNPEYLFHWVEMGVLTQITAASVLTNSTPKIRDFAFRLLEHNLAHMLVTDSHGLHVRRPMLYEGYEAVKNIIGEKSARLMVYDIPQNIIGGKDVVINDPVPFRKRSFFDFFHIRLS